MEHQPHQADIVLCIAPVAFRVQISHEEAVLQALCDAHRRHCDFPRDEGFAAPRGFVVEEDSVGCMEMVGLTVVSGNPIAVELRNGVGAARVERRGLRLGGFFCVSEKLRGGGLVETGLRAGFPHGVQKPQDTEGVRIGGVFGNVEAHAHMRLRPEIVDFVRLDFLQKAAQVAGIGEVSVVEEERGPDNVGVLVEMVYAARVEGARTADEPVNFVSLVQQKLRQIGAVLSRDACDECSFHRHSSTFVILYSAGLMLAWMMPLRHSISTVQR